MSRPILAVALAVALVLAGCSGPPGTDGTPTASPGTAGSPGTATPESTPTDLLGHGEVTVRGGSLPFNATAVWLRFLELRGLDPAEYPAPDVEVRPVPNETRVVQQPSHLPSTFAERLGFGSYTIDMGKYGRPYGYPIATGVAVHPNDGSPTEIERTLVHEFEHYVQPDDLSPASEPGRLDHQIGEGAATYVEVAYAEAHLEGLNASSDRWSTYADATQNTEKWGAAYYYFAYRYVDRRIDSPSDLSAVYEDPPQSSGQLLHGDDWAGSRPLPVEHGDSWDDTPWPAGELFLRVTLATDLDESTAASAAAGWANDTVLEADDGAGHVWVLRTTDGANASELEAAFRQYLDARATAEGDVWRTEEATFRLVRVDANTLAVVVGGAEFVDEVTVSGDGGTVVVSSDE